MHRTTSVDLLNLIMSGECLSTKNNLIFLDNPGERIGAPDLDPAFMVGSRINNPILGRNRRGELIIPVGVPNSGGFRRFQAPEISLIGEEAVSLCFGLPFSLSQLDGSGPSQATNRLSLTLEADSSWGMRIHTNCGFSEKDQHYFSAFIGVLTWNALKRI
jgi:hypothetical protein